MAKSIVGSCYCGHCKFEVNSEGPKLSIYCHCVDCRKAHSAPLYQIIYVAEKEFSLTEGEDIGHFSYKSDNFTRYFCRKCGSRYAPFIW